MKIKGFQLKKNKKFYYQPRFVQEQEKDHTSLKFQERIRTYRASSSNSMGEQWQLFRQKSRTRANREANMLLIVVFLVLFLIVMAFFEFDFSFFFTSK